MTQRKYSIYFINQIRNFEDQMKYNIEYSDKNN